MEQEMPDYETIRAAVAGEKWALEKVLACYGDEINRAWVFRALGYGHDVAWWKDLISNLRLVGYDGPISIEHEDSLMSIDEGLTKAVEVLKEAIMHDPKPTTMSWA